MNDNRMPGKVIPFPAPVRRADTEGILARHHVIIAVGNSRYEVDVLGFVTALQPAMAEGGRAVWMLTGSGVEREAAVLVQVMEWSQSRRQGWKAVLKLEGEKKVWEAYWRRLGIAGDSPAAAAEQSATNGGDKATRFRADPRSDRKRRRPDDYRLPGLRTTWHFLPHS
jgi:hypothetical protein